MYCKIERTILLQKFLGAEDIGIGTIRQRTGNGACLINIVEPHLHAARLSPRVGAMSVGHELAVGSEQKTGTGKYPPTITHKEQASHRVSQARTLGHDGVTNGGFIVTPASRFPYPQ
jgi:hypothetical protein